LVRCGFGELRRRFVRGGGRSRWSSEFRGNEREGDIDSGSWDRERFLNDPQHRTRWKRRFLEYRCCLLRLDSPIHRLVPIARPILRLSLHQPYTASIRLFRRLPHPLPDLLPRLVPRRFPSCPIPCLPRGGCFLPCSFFPLPIHLFVRSTKLFHRLRLFINTWT
jgi:hypothetical protein